MFLDDDALRKLTGYAHKARQIEQLRTMGVPFYINAAGRPVVACSVVEGGQRAPAKTAAPAVWTPSALKRA